MQLKVIVIFRNELNLSNDDCREDIHFINIQLSRYKFEDTEQIDLIDLNMKIQDKFHFIDSVLCELAYHDIILPDKKKWIRGCLIIGANNTKLDINSDQFFHIYSDFHSTL